MPITSADIHFTLAVPAAPSGNYLPQGTPTNSWGKYISVTDLVNNTPDNLFSDITGDQQAAGQVDYACLFVKNSHASLTWLAPVAWLSASGAGNVAKAIAVDNIPATPIANGTGVQASFISQNTDLPVNVGAFSSPVTKTVGLPLGDLTPGQCRAVWVRRTALNGGVFNNNSVTISVSGDTTA